LNWVCKNLYYHGSEGQQPCYMTTLWHAQTQINTNIHKKQGLQLDSQNGFHQAGQSLKDQPIGPFPADIGTNFTFQMGPSSIYMPSISSMKSSNEKCITHSVAENIPHWS
jgi:hypothetical protein